MWWQVHEMLRIEKGGEEQLKDELAAYNPMIPNGSELTCTLMFEIDDPKVRARILGALGGVEDHIFPSINGEKIAATPEGDVERSTPEGKDRKSTRRTPVTNAHLVCRLLLEKKKKNITNTIQQ